MSVITSSSSQKKMNRKQKQKATKVADVQNYFKSHFDITKFSESILKKLAKKNIELRIQALTNIVGRVAAFKINTVK